MTLKRLREIRSNAAFAPDQWKAQIDELCDTIERLHAGQKEQSAPEEAAAIVQEWNRWAELSKVAGLNADRKKHLRARLSEPFFSKNWRAAIERITYSAFCTGRGITPWRANIDWFLRPGTVEKIMEGRYDNERFPVAGKPRETVTI